MAKVHRRNGIDPGDAARIKIVLALIPSHEPLSLTEISKEAGIGRQHVHYYLNGLVLEGIVLQEKGHRYTRYKVQEALKGEALLPYLEPLFEEASVRMDIRQARDPVEAIENVVRMYLLTSSLSLEQKSFDKDQ